MDEEKKGLRSETQVNLKIQEEQAENDLENGWDSCCFRADRRAITYFTTLSISLVIIAFCIVKLSGDRSCEETNGWMSLLTFVIGIYIRAPSM